MIGTPAEEVAGRSDRSTSQAASFRLERKMNGADRTGTVAQPRAAVHVDSRDRFVVYAGYCRCCTRWRRERRRRAVTHGGSEWTGSLA